MGKTDADNENTLPLVQREFYGAFPEGADAIAASIRSGAISRIRKIGLDGAITTVAGNGARDGDLGDGGPAVNARLASPYGVAVNAAGNLYIADTSNSRIRRVTPDGIITTVAGNGIAFGNIGEGGPAADASITIPYGVAADSAGNIYFPDLFFVRKVDGSGKINALAGGGAAYSGDGGPAINAGMWGPFGVAVDAAGDVYVADGFTHSVGLLVPTATHAALTIGLTHEEAFRAGEGDASYSILIGNLSSAGPTQGVVTVKALLPEGFVVGSTEGRGWNCASDTCSRSDVLAAGQSYPPITAMVGVEANTSCQVLTQATVFGGGSAPASGNDATDVVIARSVSRLHTLSGCQPGSSR